MKTKYLASIIIGVALSACGRAPTLQLGEFAPYVEKFEAVSVDAGSPTKVTDLKIQFGELPNPRENGVCEITGDETPVITISAKKWAKMPEAKRESLLFHELGHCVLKRKHKDGVDERGVPVSLMNPYSIDPETYEEFRSYYIEELFTNRS